MTKSLDSLLVARDTDLTQARADRNALSQQLQAWQAENVTLREALAGAHTYRCDRGSTGPS